LRDVVVIGAGPAGALTAGRLAAQGVDVLVLEEHSVVGRPVHCTGLLGTEAFSEFDLPRELILGRAEAACFWGATGDSVTVRSGQVQAAVIDRADLDASLMTRAERAGAELRLNSRVDTIEVRPHEVRVTIRGASAPVTARACVLACGASYRFHRQLGLGVPEVFLQSAQLETPFPETSADIEVRFGRDIAPAGFAWLVPFRRDGTPHARVGLMSQTRSRERFRAFLDQLCERADVDRAAIGAPRLKILPLGPVPCTYASRVLAVGDAAGLVKPTTGGGIYYGLVSGEIAAEVLGAALAHDRLDQRTLSRYERRWRDRLGPEIRVGLAFRRIVTRLNDESIDALIELARVNGIANVLQQHASFNWHRKAAIALLADASFRKIVFRSWRSSANLV
jgi:digeranylgeranylglycerophospholipid reductase